MEFPNILNNINGQKINQLKAINKLINVKNDFFLQKAFNNLEKRKLLEIVKYNKNIKNRINININDYKEFCENYSSIEIEVKPVNNKYGKFINIKKENEIYYHIYFNNDKKEIKKNNFFNQNIKIIKIIINYQVNSLEELFSNCTYIETIYFKKFFRNNITNMSYMFFGCFSLKELNLKNFNTKNVTNMDHMFFECLSLKELNLNNFITNNVNNMHYMFCNCWSLESLALNNFITNNVTKMSFMFDKCSSLKELNLDNFNTIKVTNMSYMFNNSLNALL